MSLLPIHSLTGTEYTRVTSMLEQGNLRTKVRMTAYELDFGTGPLPRRKLSDLTVVKNPQVLRGVTSYRVSRSDQFSADELTFSMSLLDYQNHADVLKENSLIEVDERWSDGVSDSLWVRRGVFLIDGVTDTLQGGARQISVRARDTLKLLIEGSVRRRFWPDRVKIAKKRLTVALNAKATKSCYYILVDGESGNHTIMWAAHPKPRFYWPHSRRRLELQEGLVDVNYRNGEVLIERQFYEARRAYGGLGDPNSLDIEYWRWAHPDDEVLTAITGVDAQGITISVDGDPAWTGCEARLLSGDAKHARYRIASVAGSYLRLNGNPQADGVSVGDSVQLVNANRAEAVVRDLFLDVGFQDIDDGYPFYIRAIDPPGALAITLPGDDTTDFSEDQSANGHSILDGLRTHIPPNVIYRANSSGEADTYVLEQKDVADLSISAYNSISLELSEGEYYTRVLYRARDRSRINLLSPTSPYAAEISVPDQTTVDKAKIVPTQYLRHLRFKKDRIVRALCDGRPRTGVLWRYQINPEAVEPPLGKLDGRVLIKWELSERLKVTEAQVRAMPGDWVRGQSVELQTSEDNALWETFGDELVFSSGGEVKETTTDAVHYARYVRLVARQSGLINPERDAESESESVEDTETVIRYAGIGIADVYLFADSVVTGVAELGVDRFEDETDEQFAEDVAMRNRLGPRTYTVSEIDERGHEIAAALGISVSSYAKARAGEWLAALVSQQNPIRVSGARPDLEISMTAAVNADRLSISSVNFLVREVVTEDAALQSVVAVNYRKRASILSTDEARNVWTCDPPKTDPLTSTTTACTTTKPSVVTTPRPPAPPPVVVLSSTRTLNTRTASSTSTTACITTTTPHPDPAMPGKPGVRMFIVAHDGPGSVMNHDSMRNFGGATVELYRNGVLVETKLTTTHFINLVQWRAAEFIRPETGGYWDIFISSTTGATGWRRNLWNGERVGGDSDESNSVGVGVWISVVGEDHTDTPPAAITSVEVHVYDPRHQNDPPTVDYSDHAALRYWVLDDNGDLINTGNEEIGVNSPGPLANPYTITGLSGLGFLAVSGRDIIFDCYSMGIRKSAFDRGEALFGGNFWIPLFQPDWSGIDFFVYPFAAQSSFPVQLRAWLTVGGVRRPTTFYVYYSFSGNYVPQDDDGGEDAVFPQPTNTPAMAQIDVAPAFLNVSQTPFIYVDIYGVLTDPQEGEECPFGGPKEGWLRNFLIEPTICINHLVEVDIESFCPCILSVTPYLLDGTTVAGSGDGYVQVKLSVPGSGEPSPETQNCDGGALEWNPIAYGIYDIKFFSTEACDVGTAYGEVLGVELIPGDTLEIDIFSACPEPETVTKVWNFVTEESDFSLWTTSSRVTHDTANGVDDLGCWKYEGTGINQGVSQLGRFLRDPNAITWEEIGVPAGATVIKLQAKLYFYNVSSANISGADLLIEIYDSFDGITIMNESVGGLPASWTQLDSGEVDITGDFQLSDYEFFFWVPIFRQTATAAWDAHFKVDKLEFIVTYAGP